MFPPNIIEEVRRRAAFRCCKCQKIGIHVHHIILLSEGGSDSIDNAAPLCPNCHSEIGHDPAKRNQIIQMRDWWYTVAANKYPTNTQYLQRLDQIDSKIDQIRNDYQIGQSEWKTGMDELKTTVFNNVKDYINNIWDNLNPENISAGVSGIINSFDDLTTGTRLGTLTYANLWCRNCNTYVGLAIGTDKCPNCGNPIRNNRNLKK